MTRDDRTQRSQRGTASHGTASRRAPRWRGVTLGLLLAVTPIAAGCTPGEIEASVQAMSVSFEEGGAARGLAEAIFVINTAIPVIRMRLSGAFGP
jgi:hypothetical protein